MTSLKSDKLKTMSFINELAKTGLIDRLSRVPFIKVSSIIQTRFAEIGEIYDAAIIEVEKVPVCPGSR